MNILKVADLHLTDGKEAEYKWKFFTWLEKQVDKHQIGRVDILGDLTDKKDQHKSTLVNRTIDALVSLSNKCDVAILMGNHDYIDASSPFFKFLNHIPNITFVSEPKAIDGELFLPHARNPVEEWGTIEEDGLENYSFKKFHTINIHQCLIGSKTPTGFSLDHGMSKDFFKDYNGVVYAGDIHMPQVVGNVEYIGSPYPTTFGPGGVEYRCLLIDSVGDELDLEYLCLDKWSLRIKDPIDLDEYDLVEGDQVKIVIELHPTYFPDWPELKKEIKTYCDKAGVELHGLEMVPEKKKSGRIKRNRSKAARQVRVEAPVKTLTRFAEKEELDGRHLKAAESIIGSDIS